MNSKTQELTKKITDFFKSQVPIRSENGTTATISDLKVTIPREADDLDKQIQMKYNNQSLEGSVSGKLIIKDAKGKEISKSPQLLLLKFPIFTNRNTIILNGNEKFIQNQLTLRPGVYSTTNNAEHEVRTEMRFARQSSGNLFPTIGLIYNPDKGKFVVSVNKIGAKKINVNIVNFLRELGFTDGEIQKFLGNGPQADALFKGSQKGYIPFQEIYKAFIGHYPPTDQTPTQAKQVLYDFFKENALFTRGEAVVKDNLGTSPAQSKYFSKDVLGKAVLKTMRVGLKQTPEDKKNDIKYSELRSSTDLILDQIKSDYDVFAKSTKTELDGKGIINPESAVSFRPMLKFGDKLKDFLKQSTMVQTISDGANILSAESAGREITQFGDKYSFTGVQSGKTDDVASSALQALPKTGFNKIDPVEIPESGKLGFIEHLSQNVKLKDRTIYTPFYRVKDGVAVADPKNKKEFSALEEEKVRIAFNDPKFVTFDKKTNSYILKGTSVRGRYKGKEEMIPVNQVQYIDESPNNVLGTITNMVPFVSHSDGTRMLMACAQQKQAVNLINRENPYVSTVYDQKTGETYEEKVGKEYGNAVFSKVDGKVTSITSNKIIVTGVNGKKYEHQYYNYYPFNGTFINNDLKVEKGASVKKGQLLAEGWQSKNGKLALGLNANVMYLPYKGYNYEDGIVISQSFSNKMSSEEIHEYEISIPAGCRGGKGSKVKKELMIHSSDPGIASLDEDGIIKKGSMIKAGSIIAGWMKPIDAQNPSILDIIKSSDKGSKYTDYLKRIDAGSYINGKVVRITSINKPGSGLEQKLVVTIASSEPLKVGDKLSGRHGNKGTVTKILPDKLMPVSQDGVSAEVLLSPLGVPSRKNMGQLFEVGAGLIARNGGETRKIHNFDPKERDKVVSDMERLGLKDGRMKVYIKEENSDGTIKKIPTENPVTVGNMYLLKLKHKVDDKIQARSNAETAPSITNYMPTKQTGKAKGEKHNPQSMGEMEMKAFVGHGAVWNALETTTLKSDGAGDTKKRVALFKALSSNKIDPNDLDFAATPESLNVLSGHLKSLGLNVKPLKNNKVVQGFGDAFDALSLSPLKSSEFVKLVGEKAKVTDPNIYKARSLATSENAAGLKGGLYDPEIFGNMSDPESRNKWGYIELSSPIMNPIFASQGKLNGNIYAIVSGLKNSEVKELATGGKVMISNPEEYYKKFKNLPDSIKKEYLNATKEAMSRLGLKVGDLVDPKLLEQEMANGVIIPTKVGGDAMHSILSEVNINKRLSEAKKKLKNAKDSKQISSAYNEVRAFDNLVKNGLKASDLMLTALPVTPINLRPVIVNKENGQVINDSLNKYYANIIRANNSAKKTVSDINTDLYMPASEKARRNANLYKTISQFMGSDEAPFNLKGEQNVINKIEGKTGLLRNTMLSKKIDFSGRNVIGVDPNLNLNEVAIPLDTAKTIYKPFLIKELINMGLARNEVEAKDKIKRSHPDIKKALNRLSNDRPVIIGRQPSLHKFSMQAFKPVIKETEDGSIVRSMQLNPLIVTGFGADFDGDQMYVTVPVTEKAKEEAKNIMMPSKNLINPTDGKMVVEIRHEMLAGLYYISSGKPTGKPRQYTSYNALYKDFMSGSINSRQAVKTPLTSDTVTTGQALINWCIPEQAKQQRQYTKPWGKSEVYQMMEKLYRTAEEKEFKTISLMEISNTLDKLKKLGFNASTRSGVSISISDFTKIDNIDDIYNRRLAETQKTYGNTDKAHIQAWLGVEKELENKIKDGNVLPDGNNLKLMMESGARASKDQIKKMIGTVGVFHDIGNNLQAPVKPSYFAGLSPNEYYHQGNEARKGIYDRSVSTREPGALSRQVWHMTQDVMITQADCKTSEYITMSKNDKSIRGRYVAKNILSKNGKVICKKGQMIDDAVLNAINSDDSILDVRVRSPLRCKAPNGICQKCYGSLPGTLTPVKVGTAVGTLASQALGEPVTQMTMKTFHTGGADSSVTLGLPRIKDILNLASPKDNKADLAKSSGIITSIETKGNDTVIKIGAKTQIIKPNRDGTHKVVSVKKGDIVKAGDFLTTGSVKDINDSLFNGKDVPVTAADPKEMFKLQQTSIGGEKALLNTRDYLANSLTYAVGKALSLDNMNARHAEVLANRLTSGVKVLDPGDSEYLRGQTANANELFQWNNSSKNRNAKTVPIENVFEIEGRPAAKTYKTKTKVFIKKDQILTLQKIDELKRAGLKTISVLPRPVKYEPLVQSMQQTAKQTENWLGNIGYQAPKEGLAVGATLGQVDKLDTPKTRLMTGKPINAGEGFSLPKTFVQNVGSKMYNFFANVGKK